METTLIEKRTTEGAYGFATEAMILHADTHGRILIVDGWGGDNLHGYCYRWRHGLAIRLQPNDTFLTLAEPWNDDTTTWQAVLGGYDAERPILDWTGHVVAALARRHGETSLEPVGPARAK